MNGKARVPSRALKSIRSTIDDDFETVFGAIAGPVSTVIGLVQAPLDNSLPPDPWPRPLDRGERSRVSLAKC